MIGALISEYRIIDRLGAGGMGEVYRGVHSKIGRVVAVKVLSQAASDPSFVDRFYNEARIQANLHHPNIATLYDFIQFDNQPCIIMEYVEGQTLTERIRAVGSLQVSEAIVIFQSLVEAIEYMHGQGIIHRDIKSSNVKITPSGGVKLLDFGIAKSCSSPALTVTGGFVGTLQYLSPELFNGSQADARSDMWALGVLLYEMVTGQMVFAATTLGELYEKVSRAAYIPPPLLNPSVPRYIEAIISRCLKKSPADRYQSASELLQSLRQGSVHEANIHRGKTSYLSTILRGASAYGFKPGGDRIPNSLDQNGDLGGRQPSKWRRAPTLAGAVLSVVAGYFLISQLWPTTESTPQTSLATQQQSVTPGEKTISVELFGAPAQAQVFWNGRYIGMTPCEVKARAQDRLELEFRLEGFIQKEELVVEPNRNIYAFHWKKND